MVAKPSYNPQRGTRSRLWLGVAALACAVAACSEPASSGDPAPGADAAQPGPDVAAEVAGTDADGGASPDGQASEPLGDTGSGGDASLDSAAVDAAPDATPAQGSFAFAIVTDTHVTGPGDKLDRLAAAVKWLNTEAKTRNIQLVLVLGDIAWGAGVPLAAGALGGLEVPWVPMIGDNEVHLGAEQAFHDAFAPQYAKVATQLAGFEKAPALVDNPVAGKPSWLQNMAFDHGGVRFIGLDTAPRIDDGTLKSEQGELWDFPGGTWPWLVGQIGKLAARPGESVVLFSHIPLHGLTFDAKELQAIVALLGPVGELVYAHFGGHYHFELEDAPKGGGYTAYVTSATWGDELRVRVVTVTGQGKAFSYSHELVAVPFP